MDRIQATYIATRPDRDPETLGRAIALEQSVEVIEELVTPEIRESLVGRVESVEARGDEKYRITVSYAPEVAAGQVGQLFHLLFGNISFYPRLKLVDVTLPPAVTGQLHGPRYGIDGIRLATGIGQRPLLCTALKPRGSSVEHLARLAGEFARGGGDLLKDDQNLVHEDFESFKHRVDACATAVERANDQTGRRCLYLPHVAGSGSRLLRQLEFVHRRNLPGVLLCPLVMGLETAGRMAADFDLMYMAHPAMAGALTEPEDHGIASGVLLGTLARVSGADISIFPGKGGRISAALSECRDVVDLLTCPFNGLHATMPCPAGGKTLDMLEDMGREYGPDCAILIGGDLLKSGDRLAEVTGQSIGKLAGLYGEQQHAPAEWRMSSCELPGMQISALKHYLRKNPDFEWDGRESQLYKDDDTLPFKGVRRVELMGNNGEQMNFDLRYFELAPGGYTSLEKHLHTHVIIGARGTGTLVLDDTHKPLGEHDLAYIEPLAVHQLKNESDEPFGFYCLVDRDRDRPMGP